MLVAAFEKGVFETNSSSCHSLTIIQKVSDDPKIENGQCTVCLQKVCEQHPQFCMTFQEKLAYYIAVAMEDFLYYSLETLKVDWEEHNLSEQFQFLTSYLQYHDLSSTPINKVNTLFSDIKANLDLCRKDNRFEYLVYIWDALRQLNINQVNITAIDRVYVNVGDTDISEIFGAIDLKKVLSDDNLYIFAKIEEY